MSPFIQKQTELVEPLVVLRPQPPDVSRLSNVPDAHGPLEALDITLAVGDATSREVDQTGSGTAKEREPLDLFVDADLEDPDDPGPNQPMHRVGTASEKEQSGHPKKGINRKLDPTPLLTMSF